MNTPICYILVGVPGSGKTTWIESQEFNWTKTVIASTDDYIESMAKKLRKTYNAVFSAHMPDAVSAMALTVVNAVEQNLDIVWDQTSTTVATRAKKLRMLPQNYRKVAVVFYTPVEEEHMHRLASRPGKIIPPEVLKSMQANFIVPSIKEGFDEVRLAY